MNTRKTYKQKCDLCGYEWDARLEHPKTCSRCKRFDYNKKKEDILEHRQDLTSPHVENVEA